MKRQNENDPDECSDALLLLLQRTLHTLVFVSSTYLPCAWGLQMAACSGAHSVGIDPDRLKRIHEWQQSLVAEEKLPMTQVLIARRGKVVYNRCTGQQRLGGREAANTASLYRLYSMTKPIVSVALMMLVEEGKVMLDHPAHIYLGDKWKKKNMHVYKANSFDAGTKQ